MHPRRSACKQPCRQRLPGRRSAVNYWPNPPARLGGEEESMVVAADYPFLDIMWTMIVFFVWVLWIWTVIMMLTDVFRRDDISGWGKTGWVLFMVFLPFLGVFTYLITQHKSMQER